MKNNAQYFPKPLTNEFALRIDYTLVHKRFSFDELPI